jgi:hypothetical protein
MSLKAFELEEECMSPTRKKAMSKVNGNNEGIHLLRSRKNSQHSSPKKNSKIEQS